MSEMRWIHDATDVKSRPVALNVSVPVGPPAGTAPGAVVDVVAPDEPEVVVVAALPEMPAAVFAADDGAAVAVLLCVPWKLVSQTSSGMTRAMPCSSVPHDTSF